MVKYTNEQRLQIIKNYYRNSESVSATLRALTPIFGRNSRPSRQAITSLVKKFESTYSLCDVVVSVRQRIGRSIENIAAVQASVAIDPNQSIPRRSQELGIAQTTLWRILQDNKERAARNLVKSETISDEEAAENVSQPFKISEAPSTTTTRESEFDVLPEDELKIESHHDEEQYPFVDPEPWIKRESAEFDDDTLEPQVSIEEEIKPTLMELGTLMTTKTVGR